MKSSIALTNFYDKMHLVDSVSTQPLGYNPRGLDEDTDEPFLN